MEDKAIDYALGVISGKQPAGELHTLACQRFIDDLHSLGKAPWYYDPIPAENFEAFCKLFITVDDDENESVKPMIITPMWYFVFANLLNFKMKNHGGTDPFFRRSGARRFREAYLELPKCTAKSQMFSAFMMFACDEFLGLKRPQIMILSSGLKQNKIMIDFIQLSLQNNKFWIDEENKYYRMLRRAEDTIVCPHTGGKIISMSGSKIGVAGWKPVIVVIDEYHEHGNVEVVKRLQAGFKSNKSPLMVFTTNAGLAKGEGPCWEEHSRHVDILHKITEDDTSFGLICGKDDDDDIFDPKTWEKANHNLGLTVFHDYYARQANKAKDSDDEREHFENLWLNVWTESYGNDWVKRGFWEPCLYKDKDDFKQKFGRDFPNFPEAERKCIGGDLAQIQDLSALAPCFEFDDLIIFPKPKGFACFDNIRLMRQQKRLNISKALREQHLIPMGQHLLDFEDLFAYLYDNIVHPYGIWTIVMDCYRKANVWTALDALNASYFRQTDNNKKSEEWSPLVEAQPGRLRILDHTMRRYRKKLGDLEGFLIEDSMAKFEARLKNKKVAIEDNMLVRWGFHSVRVKVIEEGQAKVFDKKQSSSVHFGKIDLIVAMAMAVGYMDYESSKKPFDYTGLADMPAIHIQ